MRKILTLLAGLVAARCGRRRARRSDHQRLRATTSSTRSSVSSSSTPTKASSCTAVRARCSRRPSFSRPVTARTRMPRSRPSAARVNLPEHDAGANIDGPLVPPIDPVSGSSGDVCCSVTLRTLCTKSDELYDFGCRRFRRLPEHARRRSVIEPATSRSRRRSTACSHHGDPRPAGVAADRTPTCSRVSGYGLPYSSPVAAVAFRSRLHGRTREAGERQVRGLQTRRFSLQHEREWRESRRDLIAATRAARVPRVASSTSSSR